jgi:hypothetical protein
VETPILEQIYFIGQTISAIAVVLSLIYVGLQIRQNTKATRMSAAHSFLDTQNAYVGLINQSGALADILGRGADGLSNLQRGEVIQFSAFHDQAFSSFQTFFTEWKDGMLDDRLWGSHKHAMADLMVHPGVQTWWSNRKHWYDSTFQAYVDETASAGIGKPMHYMSQ